MIRLGLLTQRRKADEMSEEKTDDQLKIEVLEPMLEKTQAELAAAQAEVAKLQDGITRINNDSVHRIRKLEAEVERLKVYAAREFQRGFSVSERNR
jgi:hypothetical protein